MLNKIRWIPLFLLCHGLSTAPFAFGQQVEVKPTEQKESANKEVIHLWADGAPGFEDRKDEPEQAESYWVKNVHNPSITAFLPEEENATGAAVLICPGGGHRMLVFEAEGVDAAKYFNKLGIAAFVLKYRLAREEKSPYELTKHCKEDAQRALRLIRSRAREWQIDKTRLGIMGFSAGGEVVSLVAYETGQGDANAVDPIDRLSARPDFQILVYPGPVGIPEEVPLGSPPAFLVVANDDVGASKSIFALMPKLRAAGVSMEAHVYARGGHAFNMGYRTPLVTLKGWPQRLEDWMTDSGFMGNANPAAESK